MFSAVAYSPSGVQRHAAASSAMTTPIAAILPQAGRRLLVVLGAGMAAKVWPLGRKMYAGRRLTRARG